MARTSPDGDGREGGKEGGKQKERQTCWEIERETDLFATLPAHFNYLCMSKYPSKREIRPSSPLPRPPAPSPPPFCAGLIFDFGLPALDWWSLEGFFGLSLLYSLAPRGAKYIIMIVFVRVAFTTYSSREGLSFMGV